MSTMKRAAWVAAIVLGCVGLGSRAAPAQETIYDGLTFAQFKSILATTKLTLEERTTQKGNKYVVITIPGAATSFIGSMVSCPKDRAQPCDGFSYFFIEDKRTMTTDAMARFNREYQFLKALPSLSNPNNTVIENKTYAVGGITAKHVLAAGAYYTAAVADYRSSGTIAGAPGTTSKLSFTKSIQPEAFFAELAAKGEANPVPSTSPVDEGLIDALADGQR